MAVPFALGKVIDIIYNLDKETSETSNKLNSVCLGLAAVFVLGGICNFGRVYLMRVSGQRMTARLRNNVFSSIMKQEIAFFDRTRTGELVNRLSADSQLVSSTLTNTVSDGLRSTVMTSAGVGMMFYMCPQLAIVGLGVVPPVALWAVYMGKKVKKVSKDVQDSLADATQVAEEKISNIRSVRLFAKEFEEMDNYTKKMDVVLDKSIREASIQATFYGVTGFSGNMIILTVLYYGGSLVTTEVISVGNLTSFILYAAYVGIGLSGMSTFYAEVMKGIGASGRLWELVDRPPAVPLVGGLLPTVQPRGNIAFDNVSFSYPSRPDVPIIKNLNLHIPQDTKVAVVGSSGSGKSTLGLLLLRLYEPDVGRICLDDVDIKSIDPSWLRTHVGTVSQEPILFSSSIRDNILYGAHDTSKVSNEQIEWAAEQANAHEFITSFPSGYSTLVGERGVMLSGGQKQRVAIARAILKNPHILLLDEATSALDAQSEYEVKEALERLMINRTVIIIAHRLSTIRNADKIAVLEKGEIMEFGAFDELIKIDGGLFKALVDRQTLLDN